MSITRRPNSWTKRDERQLRELWPTATAEELLRQFPGRTLCAIKSRASRLGVNKGTYRNWTPADDERFRALYPDTRTRALAKLLGRSVLALFARAEILGVKKSAEYIAQKKKDEARRLRASGKAHRFPKGNVPMNKGLRRPGWCAGRMKETQFKKGQVSRNVLPVGTVIPDSEGFLRRKVAVGLGGFGNREVWEYVHRRNWVEAHGPIPKHHVLRFRDGNRNNCAESNLELVTMRENMLRNSLHRVLPPDLRRVVQLCASLKAKITKRRKKAAA